METEKEIPTKKLEAIDLDELALKLADKIEKEDEALYTSILRKQSKNRNYYRGNQRGYWDKAKKTWVNIDIDLVDPQDASILVINNQFRPQVKTLIKEYSRSETNIKAIPTSDSQTSVLASRFGDSLIKYNQHEILTERKRQQEAKYILLCGGSYRFTDYKYPKDATKVSAPKYGGKKVDSYSKHICSGSDCEMEFPEERDTCDKCGSKVQNVVVPEQNLTGVYLGNEKKNSGKLDLDIVDPIEVKRWEGGKGGDVKDSPYIRRLRIVREEFFTENHPDFEPKKEALSSYGEFQRQLMSLAGLDMQSQVGSEQVYYEFYEAWLDVSMYCKYKSVKEVEIGETTYPAGTPLEEIFPDGWKFAKQGKKVILKKNQAKNPHWLYIPYDINVDGATADGLEDAVQNQQIINEYTSMGVENVLYNASPKLIFNPHMINGGALNNSPKDAIPLTNNARKDTDPSTTFSQIKGMSLSEEVFEGIENKKRDMREQTGALLGFNGQSDPNNKTATGMVVQRDSALALSATSLALVAEGNRTWNYQCLDLIQKNWVDNKYNFLLGKYNESEAEAFKKCDLEQEITLAIEPFSWMPMTPQEKLQNLGAYLTAFGLPLGFLNPMVPESIRQYASQLYSIPFEVNELSPDIRIAQRRLDKAKDEAKIRLPLLMAKTAMLQGNMQAIQEEAVGTLLAISNSMEIEEDLDNHMVFIDVYTKYLKTDEGQEANKILRQAIKEKIAEHKDFLDMQMKDAATKTGQNNALSGEEPPSGNSDTQTNFEPQQPAQSPFTPNRAKPNERRTLAG